MTAAEDAANAIHNEIMRECSHDPYLTPSGGIECRSCGGHFALVLKPRLAKVIPITNELEKDYCPKCHRRFADATDFRDCSSAGLGRLCLTKYAPRNPDEAEKDCLAWANLATAALTVEQARKRYVCRICGKRADGPLTMDFGKEFAHTACLPPPPGR